MGALARVLVFGGVVAAVLLAAGAALIGAMGLVLRDVVATAFETEHDDERVIRP